jgi:hypothetical protein
LVRSYFRITQEGSFVMQLDRIAEAGVLSSALLLTGHITLYGRLSRIESYAYGTSALGAGLSWYGIRSGQPGAVVAFWALAGIGGATVAGCYKAREILLGERRQGLLADQLWHERDTPGS